jgi:hypothetical protein
MFDLLISTAIYFLHILSFSSCFPYIKAFFLPDGSQKESFKDGVSMLFVLN